MFSIFYQNKYDISILCLKKLGTLMNNLPLMLPKKILFFIFFLLTAFIKISSMEKTIPEKNYSHTVFVKAQKIINFFAPKDVDPYNPEHTFKTHLAISPDKQQIIASQKGTIYSVHLNQHKEAIEPQELFSHPNITTHHTLLSLHIKESNKSLVICSGGNYYDQQKSKHTSEIIIYKNGSYKTRQLHQPIDVLNFSHENILFTAHKTDIYFLNLKEKIADKIQLTPPGASFNQTINGLKLNDSGTSLVASTDHKQIALYKLRKTQTAIDNFANHFCADEIQDIHFPTKQTIIIATKNEVKTIPLLTFCEVQSQLHSSPLYKAPAGCNKLNLDDSPNIAVAYWTNNPDQSLAVRETIHVYRVKNPNRSSTVGLDTPFQQLFFKLIIDLEEEQGYTIINNNGKKERMDPHFITVSLYDDLCVALTTTGKIFVWMLPLYDTKEQHDKTYAENLHASEKNDKIAPSAVSPSRSRNFKIITSSPISRSKSGSPKTPRKNPEQQDSHNPKRDSPRNSAEQKDLLGVPALQFRKR